MTNLSSRFPSVFLQTLTLLAALLQVACQPAEDGPPTAEKPKAAETRPAIDSLDKVTADDRRSRLSGLEYDIRIQLDEDSEQFSGTVTIRFNLEEPGSASGPVTDLTVDFGGGTVRDTSLNGYESKLAYNGYFLTLPAGELHSGQNSLTVDFTQNFSHDGTGLHRFTDPEDGLTYLYSYLWPYYANRVFPAFDQPNLKARFSLNVVAPKEWIVVSTSPGKAEALAEPGLVSWTFEPTPPITTYAFSLHAGPYSVWESNADGIPLRLMARQSLAEYVAVDEWFDVTRRGLDYYGEYFDIPYPFGKYDQLLVPDFAIGAMENVAAVTFNELIYVQRQTSKRSEREQRASTILHEMAHMWFGNLVTHGWWNGMWLNESFATQMAAMATLATTEFDDTWHGFFTDSKQKAYLADSRVTTHPIELPINNTIDFFQVFDAITYQKGASVLKQLAHYVGEENYRLGVSDYLKAHAYGNTELEDFIAYQSRFSGKDVKAWADDWLYQPGFNTLAAKPACEESLLQSLTVEQAAPPTHPVLRHHQVDIALYAENSEGQLQEARIVAATLEGSSTPVEIPKGLPCPVLINPNHDDWTLAGIQLDQRSLETLQNQLHQVREPLARSMFLDALKQQSRSGEAPLDYYLEAAMHLAEAEDVIRIQQQIADSVIETVNLMQRLRPETDNALERWLPRLEQDFLQKARNADSSDLKRIWFNSFLSIAASEAGMETMTSLLDGSQQIDGLPMSADLRWQILIRLAGNGLLHVDSLLDAEQAADQSDYAAKQLLTAHAARPDLENKAHWLSELRSPESLTGLSRQRAVMAGMFPPNQTMLQMQLLDGILQTLPALSHQVDPYFMSSYVRTLLTPMCQAESTEKMHQALDTQAAALDSTALRFLREALQADEECSALRPVQSPASESPAGR